MRRAYQLACEAESKQNSDESNVLVKLPERASLLRHDVDREKEILCYDRPTASSDDSE